MAVSVNIFNPFVLVGTDEHDYYERCACIECWARRLTTGSTVTAAADALSATDDTKPQPQVNPTVRPPATWAAEGIMFRCYCDICGADITNYKADRAEGQNGRLRVSVMTAVDNVWNGGHACEECIRAACATVTFARHPNTAAHLTPAAGGSRDDNDTEPQPQMTADR